MKTIVIRGCVFKVSKAQYEELMKMEKEFSRQDWANNKVD